MDEYCSGILFCPRRRDPNTCPDKHARIRGLHLGRQEIFSFFERGSRRPRTYLKIKCPLRFLEADAVVTWLRAAARCHMIRQYANRFRWRLLNWHQF